MCPPFLTSLSLAKLGNKNLWSRQGGDGTICSAGMWTGISRLAYPVEPEGRPDWRSADRLQAKGQSSPSDKCVCDCQVWSRPPFIYSLSIQWPLKSLLNSPSFCLNPHYKQLFTAPVTNLQLFHQWNPLKHSHTDWHTADLAEVRMKVLLLKEIATKQCNLECVPKSTRKSII